METAHVINVGQGWAFLVLEGHCPAKSSFNPNHTHLNVISKSSCSFDSILQLCLIRVGAKLCRTVALQECPPLI